MRSRLIALGCLLAALSGPAARAARPALPEAAAPHILRSAYARWRASLPATYPQKADYRRVLLRWVAGAEKFWAGHKDHPHLGRCRMRARHDAVCTARALPIYATLAADPDNGDRAWTRDKLAERLNHAIAFLCATYGPRGAWGIRPGRNSLRYETWIIGNLLDAVQMAPERVTPELQAHVRRILIEVVEAERTSGRARSLKDYRHEGITWTMNLFARAALVAPEHPRAPEWLDLAKHAFASALSVETDARDATVLEGKPVREWVARRCPVFYPDHTLNHHGLGIHPGYMAGAAHRVVFLYALLRQARQPVSPVWLHNYRHTTGALKRLALWDGRIAFPNGKDWNDYLYLVSSIRIHMVGLQMMYGDRVARRIEQGLFRQIEWLQKQRGQGDFGPSNAEYVFNVNDAKNVAIGYWLHQRHGHVEPAPQAELDREAGGVFYSPHAGFVCVRDPQRFASWGWRARRGRLTGVVLPSGHGLGDHLAQWDNGFIPNYWQVDGRGRERHLMPTRRTRRVETFPGGFAVSERSDVAGRLTDHRCMVALPDGRTVLVAAAGRATRDLKRLATRDINWRFVRNAFSDHQRTLFHPGGHTEARHVRDLPAPWLNLEDVMAVLPVGPPARVTCDLAGPLDDQGRPKEERDEYGSTAGVTVRLRFLSLPPSDFKKGEEIFTTCVAFVTDVPAAHTAPLAAAFHEEKQGDTVRVYRTRGRDGKRYVVAVNFADAEAQVSVAGVAQARLLTPQAATATPAAAAMRLRLVPRGCAVLVY